MATGTESLMVQFLNCPAEGTGSVKRGKMSRGKQEERCRKKYSCTCQVIRQAFSVLHIESDHTEMLFQSLPVWPSI